MDGDTLVISNFGTLPIRKVMVRDQDDNGIGLDLVFLEPNKPKRIPIPEKSSTPSHIIFDDARGLKWIEYPGEKARRFRKFGFTSHS